MYDLNNRFLVIRNCKYKKGNCYNAIKWNRVADFEIDTIFWEANWPTLWQPYWEFLQISNINSDKLWKKCKDNAMDIVYSVKIWLLYGCLNRKNHFQKRLRKNCIKRKMREKSWLEKNNSHWITSWLTFKSFRDSS